MTRVVWQTTSAGTAAAWSAGGPRRTATGGTLYELEAFRILARHLDFGLDPGCTPRGEHGGAAGLVRLWGRTPACDLLVKDQRMTAMGRRGRAPATLGIVHHIDFSLGEHDPRYRLYLALLKARLPRLDAVVTVSRYWQDVMVGLGCKDVNVIYNAFDPADYALAPGQVDAFFEKFGFPRDRPLVYLGGAGPGKGGAEAWQALRDEGYSLLLTGKNPKEDPPVRTLLLDRADFVAMLHAASAVVTLSTLPEGWNRIAHEAMLCGTPVVGSGAAGMRELLDRGGQLVCPTGEGLAAAVRAAVARREELAASGRAFVGQFDLGYFERAWLGLVGRLAAAGRAAGGGRHVRD